MSLIFLWVFAACVGVEARKWLCDETQVAAAESVVCRSVNPRRWCKSHHSRCWRSFSEESMESPQPAGSGVRCTLRIRPGGRCILLVNGAANPRPPARGPRPPTFTDNEEREDGKYDEDKDHEDEDHPDVSVEPGGRASDTELPVLASCLALLLLCVAAAGITITIKKCIRQTRGSQKVPPDAGGSPEKVPQVITTIYATANTPDALRGPSAADHFYEEIPNKAPCDAQEDGGYSTVGPSNQDQQGQSEGQKPTEGAYSLLGLPSQ